MNQSYLAHHHQHHQPYPAPASSAAPLPGHFGQFPHPIYSPPGSTFPAYTYAHGLTSPPSPVSQMPSQMLPHPGSASSHGYMPGTGYPQTFDTTGQVPPPGMRSRVTQTLWEDEGTCCYQVEAKGICVARRDDTNMINGTKLLNVAGMTRGRRDGILKSEKVRQVMKIGPMHLKGVWIPFDRALEFANKERITDLLYPLFVHNIASLLNNPSNHTRVQSVIPNNDRRSLEGVHGQSLSASGTPQSMNSSHHGRSSLSKSQTLPPVSTEAPAGQGHHVHSSSYDWSTSGPQNHHYHQGLCFDTRSLPPTPMTTNTPNTHPFSSPPPPPYMSKYYMATAGPNGAPHYVASHPSLQHHYPPQGNDYGDGKYHPAGISHARGDVTVKSENFPGKNGVNSSDIDGHHKASPVTNDSTSASYSHDRHGASPPSSVTTSATAVGSGSNLHPYHGLGITTAVETSSTDQAASPDSLNNGNNNNNNNNNNTANTTESAKYRPERSHSRPESQLHAQAWPSPPMPPYAAHAPRTTSSRSAHSESDNSYHVNVTSIPRGVTSATTANPAATAAAHDTASAFPNVQGGYSDMLDTVMRSASAADFSKKRTRDTGSEEEGGQPSSAGRDAAAVSDADADAVQDGDIKRRKTVVADARPNVDNASFARM